LSRHFCGGRARRRIADALVVSSIAIGAPGAVAAAIVTASDEILVNSYTSELQLDPVVAADAQGRFLVVWTSQHQDGQIDGVFARAFDKHGTPQGVEQQVNEVTAFNQRRAAVTAVGEGRFAVAWMSTFRDGSAYGVAARVLDATGAPLTGEFQVNAYTVGSQHYPAIASADSSSFLVVWRSEPQGTMPLEGIVGRRFDAAGAALGVELRLDGSFPPGHRPSLSGSKERYVVAWESSGGPIFARRLDLSGTPIGEPVLAASFLDNRRPSVALNAHGGFVVAWTRFRVVDGLPSLALAQRFAADGARVGGELQVHSFTLTSQHWPCVAAGRDDSFIVAWRSAGFDFDGGAAMARRFHSGGRPQSSDFVVDEPVLYQARCPSVALLDGDRDFVVAWQSPSGVFGLSTDIQARVFSHSPSIDVDGDGEVALLTDALLLLRYGFGFRGAVLVDDAVADGCTRCDAASIEGFIGGLL
jgi:hypothetical protein